MLFWMLSAPPSLLDLGRAWGSSVSCSGCCQHHHYCFIGGAWGYTSVLYEPLKHLHCTALYAPLQVKLLCHKLPMTTFWQPLLPWPCNHQCWVSVMLQGGQHKCCSGCFQHYHLLLDMGLHLWQYCVLFWMLSTPLKHPPLHCFYAPLCRSRCCATSSQ